MGKKKTQTKKRDNKKKNKDKEKSKIEKTNIKTNIKTNDKMELAKKLNFRMIYIDGLTLTKYIDIEENFFKNDQVNIICLTETHKKVEDIYISKKIKSFSTMRKKKTKRGVEYKSYYQTCQK